MCNIENIPVLFEGDNFLLETLEKSNNTAWISSNCLQSFNSKTVTNRPLADSILSQNNTAKKATRGISSTTDSSKIQTRWENTEKPTYKFSKKFCLTYRTYSYS